MKKITFNFLVVVALLLTSFVYAQFNESFEGGIPGTWTVINGGDTNTWTATTPGTGSAHTGTNVARINYSSTAHDDHLITQQFMVTSGVSDRFSFWYKHRSNSFPEIFDVLLSTTGNTAPDFTVTLASGITPDATTWQLAEYDLSVYDGQMVYISFYTSTTDEWELYIDDVVVDTFPSCIAPNNLAVDNVTAYTVDLNWNDLGGTTDYEYAIQPFGTGEPTMNGVYGDYNSLPLTTSDDINYNPLTPSTAYEVWVRADCGANGYSAWVGPVNFTTSSVVMCGTPENVTYCYTDNDTTFWTFSSSDGSPLRVTFNAGEVENTWDELIVYDSDGVTELYNGYGNAGDLTGLVFDSTGDTITVQITSDGSGSCSGGGYATWDFTVACATCVNPTATLTTAPDCANSQYSIDVDLTSLGSATSVTISDGTTTLTNISATGNQTFGPYADGASVTITITNEQDGSCSYSSGSYSYSCPPANDECDNAVALTVNPDFNCGVVTAGTTVAATDSGIEPTFTVTGTPDNDVWFSFVATGTDHQISLANVVAVVGTSTDMGMALFDGSGTCSSLALVGSSDPNTYNATGLTPGVTYYVAVYGWGAGPGAQATFDICVGTPPAPPANDECSGAVALTVNADLNCGVQTSGTIAGATASSVDTAACGGTENDDVWYSFVATSTSHVIALNNVVGSTTDLYHSLWTGADCNSLTLVPGTCSDPNSSAPSGLTIGTTYYIRVYSWGSGAGQTTTFDVCVGTLPPPPANDECDNAITLTVNADYNCGVVTSATNASATASSQADDVTGTPNNDVWFSFVATQTAHRITLTNVVAATGTSTDMGMGVYDATGGCSALNFVADSDPNTLDLTGLTIGNTYLVRVYNWETNAANTDNFDICVGTDPALSSTSFDATNFKAYPNPVSDILNLEYKSEMSNIQVINLLGQTVINKAVNATSTQVDMSQLNAGAYIVNVTIDGNVETIKVVKQ